MKKIFILNIVFLAFLSLTSCNQEEIQTYSGTDNIYFSPSVYPITALRILTDSVGVSFALEKPVIIEKTYKIPIRVQGKLSDADRKVKVSIDPSSTAVQGTHFKLPDNIVMHAGREVDTIEVKFFRTPEMKNKSFLLVLNLEENEAFTTKMESTVTNVLTKKTMSHVRFKLSIDDKLTQPPGWFTTYLSTFSAKKFFLMCDLIHLEPEMFNQKLGSPGLAIADIQYYGNFMKRYLADQKAMGNIIYDENGTEMFFL
ncbi:protein of unknown function [Flavobacterium aquidurense]|uniref:DUF4843 domain-containing protein n=1 Tax=Flavobacterium frigidimaris TaxID=262320 RepID=A0ABX4BR26_FLAFR|nr:DUF4843 domain-containing protein [Flavobacterium frigidimaris]OXA79087.1 hypothetical protein B0A65_11095 [Flavobacterium frigidimaris]SDY81519.1 protein of unknown function [Flavobacterium aquidurense]